MIALQRSVLAPALGLGLALGFGTGGATSAEETESDLPAVSAPADPSQAEDPKSDANDESEDPENTPTEMPRFMPRDVGAPSARVGGATRGAARQALPRIEALTPEPVGYTLETRPDLYWHLSEPTDHRVDLTIIEQDTAEPLLETTLTGPFRAGVQTLRLADHGVELKPEVAYLWYVSLVPDPERRSDDRRSGGGIQRLVAPELRKRVAGAPPDRRAYVLAEAGVWYDAVAVLSERIAGSGDAAAARAQRASLLRQVGLERLAGEAAGASR